MWSWWSSRPPVYKDLEHKEVVTQGFGHRDEALRVIAEGRAAVGPELPKGPGSAQGPTTKAR